MHQKNSKFYFASKQVFICHYKIQQFKMIYIKFDLDSKTHSASKLLCGVNTWPTHQIFIMLNIYSISDACTLWAHKHGYNITMQVPLLSWSASMTK